MQTHNKNIDQLFNEKANAYKADEGFMMQDFNAIRNNLPTSATPIPGAGSTQPWFFSKIVLSVFITTIVTIVIITATNSSKKTNNNTANNSLSTQNTIAPLTDTIKRVTTPTDTIKPKKRVLYKLKVKFTPPPPPYSYKDLNYIDDDNALQDNIVTTTTNPKVAEQQLKTFLSELNNPSQFYTVNTSKDTTITCKEGTQLYIKAHSFTQLNKELVTGNVQLEVREAYSYTDMIANNLHTVSNGNLLESGGMIYLNAKQDNTPLDINIYNPIQVEMPTSNKKEGMQLFYLDKNANDNSLNTDDANWVANGQVQNAKNEDENSPVVDSFIDFKIEKGSRYNLYSKAAKFELGLLTKKQEKKFLKRNKNYKIQNSQEKRDRFRSGYINANDLINKTNLLMKNFYTFALRNFGWINCDRFYQNKNLIEKYQIEMPTQNDIYVSTLLFPKINNLLQGFNYQKMTLFNNIPNNEEVILIAFKTTNNKVLTCIQKLTTSKEGAKAGDFIELSPA